MTSSRSQNLKVSFGAEMENYPVKFFLESDPAQDSTVQLGFDVLIQCPDSDNVLIIALYSGNL